MNSTVLRATKAMGRESRQTRKERVAVVEAWQNEWGDQRYCSLGRKTLRDTSESAKLVATGIGGLINAGFHGQYVCCRGECRGFWRSESGTVLSSCWRQLTARVGLCYRQAEGCWRSESGTVLSSSWRLLTVREWDCAIVKLKAVDGQRVGLCYRHAEGCWRSEWDCTIVKRRLVFVLFRRASLVFSPFSPSLVCLIHSNKINRREQKENHKIKRGEQST